MSSNTFLNREWQLQPDELPPLGAHLIARRLGYTHHGIYVGEGLVIHYSGFSRGWSSGPIEEVTLEQFTRREAISVRSHSNPRYDPDEIVERARSRLAENLYHLLKNNCEHFCEWCILGTARSRQVEQLSGGPRRAGLRILGALKRRIDEYLGGAGPASGGWAS